MPAVVHACECDGGHHSHYSTRGLSEHGGDSSNNNTNEDGNEIESKNDPDTAHADSDSSLDMRRGRGRCPETAEFDTGQISISLRGRGEPKLIHVRMCKACWLNFKRRSDRTLNYWGWECYPRGLLPEGDDAVLGAGEVVIVRLARLWPTGLWSELGG